MAMFPRAAPPPGIDAVPSPVATASPMSQNADDGECHLLGSFSIIIQGALGALALLSLVYKRWRERPQRPVKIWAFDVSKQVVGSILLHLVNLAMSEVSSGAFEVVAAATKGAQGGLESVAEAMTASGNGGDAPTGEAREGMGMAVRASVTLALRGMSFVVGRAPDGEMPKGAQNPCSFYLLNLAIDTTIGIPILITLLRVVTYIAKRTPLANPPESIDSGKYGQPPKTTWWLKQCLIYFIGLLGMKLCVFGIFQLCPWLGAVGDWALRWTEGSQELQIIFVMFLFPLIMNAMQYYIVDTFIKEQKPKDEYQEISQEEDAVVGGEGAAEAGRINEEDDVSKARSGGIVPGRGRQSEESTLLGSESQSSGANGSTK